jgi:hypothetical protein
MNPTNILIGIGVAVAVPVVLPVVITVIRPLAKAAIKGGFTLVEKITEYTAEAAEQVSDLYAEAKSEHVAGGAAADVHKS